MTNHVLVGSAPPLAAAFNDVDHMMTGETPLRPALQRTGVGHRRSAVLPFLKRATL